MYGKVYQLEGDDGPGGSGKLYVLCFMYDFIVGGGSHYIIIGTSNIWVVHATPSPHIMGRSKVY